MVMNRRASIFTSLSLVVAATFLNSATLKADEPALFNPYLENHRPIEASETDWVARQNQQLQRIPSNPVGTGVLQTANGRKAVPPQPEQPNFDPTRNNDIDVRRIDAARRDILRGQRPTGREASALSVGLRGLVMNRDHAVDQLLATATNGSTLSTRDASQGAGGGFEISLTRHWKDQDLSDRITYWGLFSDGESASISDAAGLSSPLDYSTLSYAGYNTPMSNFGTSSVFMRLDRSFEYHNIEWNVISARTEAEGISVSWMAGARYFKVHEGLSLHMDTADQAFTGSTDEVSYLLGTTNHLVGFQVGAEATVMPIGEWKLGTAAKAGIYGNAIDKHTSLEGPAGYGFIDDDGNPNDERRYNYNPYKGDVSMLGELDINMSMPIRESATLQIGYRAVFVSGLALASDQIPASFGSVTEAQAIDSGGSMILHGAFAGLTWKF